MLHVHTVLTMAVLYNVHIYIFLFSIHTLQANLSVVVLVVFFITMLMFLCSLLPSYLKKARVLADSFHV
jgi:glucan phosphoethanolaminetransferase (alkaline phosphatase superfamily)